MVKDSILVNPVVSSHKGKKKKLRGPSGAQTYNLDPGI